MKHVSNWCVTKRGTIIEAHFGGEEFVLVMLDTSIEDCHKYLEKVIEKVKAQQVRFGEQLLGTMSLSIGVVEASESVMEAEELLSAADKAMYAAKHAGRDCIIYTATWKKYLPEVVVLKAFEFRMENIVE